MGLKDRFLELIGIDAAEQPEEKDIIEDPVEPEEPEVRTETKRPARESHMHGTEPAGTPNVAAMKMIVYHPASVEDAQSIVDNLREKKPIIVNMEDLELNISQRIMDILSGANYALQGTIRKISRNIYVIAPSNCDVIGSEQTGDDYVDM